MPATPPRNLFFPLVVVAGGLFLFTVLAMVAAALGDPRAPANRFFQAYGMWLIVGETAALVLVALLAMGIDQHQSRRRSDTPSERRGDTPQTAGDAGAAGRDRSAGES